MNDFTSEIMKMLGNRHFWYLVLAYVAVANAIGTMPRPDAKSSKFYAWVFAFLQLFASNVSRIVAKAAPQLQQEISSVTVTQTTTKTPEVAAVPSPAEIISGKADAAEVGKP
jgi:hypothetical protein